jgi:hypothetical protein
MGVWTWSKYIISMCGNITMKPLYTIYINKKVFKRLSREYYNQLYTYKFDSLDEIDHFHKTINNQNSPNQYETNNLNSSMTIKNWI